MILRILFSLRSQRLTTAADFLSLSFPPHKLDRKLQEEKSLCAGQTIAWTVTLVSGTNCNHTCFFPASNLEMIMSSTLWHTIGFCYLTMVPWPLRLSKVSCSKLENCRNTFPCGTVTKYYSAAVSSNTVPRICFTLLVTCTWREVCWRIKSVSLMSSYTSGTEIGYVLMLCQVCEVKWQFESTGKKIKNPVLPC